MTNISKYFDFIKCEKTQFWLNNQVHKGIIIREYQPFDIFSLLII